MEGYLVLGKVLNIDGEPYEDFVTFTAPYALPIRGGRSSSRGVCETCGQLGYYPLPHGYEYIARESLRPGRLLYACSLYLLVLNEELLDRIDLKTCKKLRITELPVKNEPEDGIADFPTVYL